MPVITSAPSSVKGQDCLSNDAGSTEDLLFVDHQRRCQPNDVAVGGLCKQAKLFHLQANIISLDTILLLDHHRVQKSFTSDLQWKNV